jgi:hypothetical protein
VTMTVMWTIILAWVALQLPLAVLIGKSIKFGTVGYKKRRALREIRGTTRVSSGARAHLLMREQLKWYDEKADNAPWLNALAELRQRATREGHCFQHVQAITVAIDQYAEKALGNRDYFLNKPYGVG